MTMLTQTRDKKTIHPKQCNEMAKPRQKLQEQWKKRHEVLRNKQEHESKPTQNENENESDSKYVKKPKQTYIMQLVQGYPGMPSALELDDNKRKQLAELMLEYPTKKTKTNKSIPRENKRKRNDTTHA